MSSETESYTLADMVDYQEGSVVSKTVINKKNGSVTLFAFYKGQGLSEHKAPYDALVQILDGKAEIKLSGKPYRLAKGEIILMPANQPHALTAIDNFKMMLTMIKSED